MIVNEGGRVVYANPSAQGYFGASFGGGKRLEGASLPALIAAGPRELQDAATATHDVLELASPPPSTELKTTSTSISKPKTYARYDIKSPEGQKMLDKYAKDNAFSLVLDVSGQQNPVLWAAETVNDPFLSLAIAADGHGLLARGRPLLRETCLELPLPGQAAHLHRAPIIASSHATA